MHGVTAEVGACRQGGPRQRPRLLSAATSVLLIEELDFAVSYMNNSLIITFE